jgi:hypothetical protein
VVQMFEAHLGTLQSLSTRQLWPTWHLEQLPPQSWSVSSKLRNPSVQLARVGACVGAKEGCADGTWVGAAVGTDGTVVGAAVGTFDGTADGRALGAAVGENVVHTLDPHKDA